MSITSISELPERTGSLDKDKQTYTRAWQVRSNSRADDPADVLAAISATVSYGAQHPSDVDAFCKSISVDELSVWEDDGDKGCLFKVTATYDTDTASPNEGQNPLEVPAQYSWSGQQGEQIVEFDINETAILNSAGDPFADPLIRKVSLVQLTITKNVASFDGSLALNYMNRVNSTSFLGGAVGRVFCDNISATGPSVENDITFYSVTMSFLYDPLKSWQPRVLDQGYRYKSGSERKNIIIQGKEVTSPVPLNGSGGVLAVGAAEKYLDFEIYESNDFNSLPIA